MQTKERLKTMGEKLKSIVLPVVAYGGVAGILSGFLVGVFNFVARYLLEVSGKIYQSVIAHPWAIPIFFLGLAGLAMLMALLHKFIPNVRGSGIPNVEGSVRGVLSFKWLRTLFGTVVGSFISFFAGLPLGSEGPSVQLGAMTAQGVTEMMKAKLTWRRYVMAGGAGAGISVAFNAPLTGIIFAMEECHKRISPMILLCASSSVISGTATYRLLGMAIKNPKWSSTSMLFDIKGLEPFGDFKQMSSVGEFAEVLGILIGIGAVIGALAILFNFLLIRSQKILDRYVKQFPYWARLLLAFLLTGALGLVFTKCFEDDNGFAFLNTGGHSLIDLLCHSGLKYSFFMLFGVLVLRMILLLVCYNSGATGGLFIPMLAMGALLGAMLGTLFVKMGMDSMYFPAVIVISMTTFFGASVRAPITAIVLVVELSGYQSDFLPIAISIFTAYLVAEILGNMPIYDSMLDRLVEQNASSVVKKDFVIAVEKGTFAVGRQIKDIMWPANALITQVMRANGESLIPDGKTRLKEGDKLTIVVKSSDFHETEEFLSNLLEKNKVRDKDGDGQNHQDLSDEDIQDEIVKGGGESVENIDENQALPTNEVEEDDDKTADGENEE
ncbi:MAG: chloride channel protein [Clostridia bacterium]|nr:chloride channel protein [Clostridia bacterium]